MKTKKIFGWAIHALLATVSISAHAQQYLTCPVPWHLLRLSQAELDAVVLGIRVRDWTLQDLERMRVKSEECVRSGPGVDYEKVGSASQDDIVELVGRNLVAFFSGQPVLTPVELPIRISNAVL